jgi:hypothetical protein
LQLGNSTCNEPLQMNFYYFDLSLDHFNHAIVLCYPVMTITDPLLVVSVCILTISGCFERLVQCNDEKTS